MDRNPPITNHKSWPFEQVKVKFCFLRGPLRWLTDVTVVKNAIVSWLLNFTILIRMFVKSVVSLFKIKTRYSDIFLLAVKMRPIQLFIGRFPFNPKFRKCGVPTGIFRTSFEGDPLWPVWSFRSEFSTFSGNFPVGRADETCSIYRRTGNSGNFD